MLAFDFPTCTRVNFIARKEALFKITSSQTRNNIIAVAHGEKVEELCHSLEGGTHEKL